MKRGLKQGTGARDGGKDCGGLRCLWTEAEDKMLHDMAAKHKAKHWEFVAEAVASVSSGRVSKKSAKQCRERWHNHLNPGIKTEPWSTEEEAVLFRLHRLYGNKWSDISHKMTGRTDNAVKNYFFCKLRKIIRCVKNEVVSPEFVDSSEHASQSAYLLAHLFKYYVSEEHCENVIKFITPYVRRRKNLGDKYILDSIKEANITAAKFRKYVQGLVATLPAEYMNETLHECADLLPPVPANPYQEPSTPPRVDTPPSLPKLPLLPGRIASCSSIQTLICL